MNDNLEIKVAIVEDNSDLRECVSLNLSCRDFTTTAFPNGFEFDVAVKEGMTWDVLVLDLGLPGENGLSIARRMRKHHPGMGIVMLTARGAIEDRVAGRDSGADIYLVKPADMDELASAIRAVVRRIHASTPEADAWKLDEDLMTITPPDGAAIPITYQETAILKKLCRSHNHFCDRDGIVEAMEKNPDAYDPRALEVTMSRLRHKLGENAPLKSVRTKGYVFAAKLALLARK